jgi:hypothetical protein
MNVESGKSAAILSEGRIQQLERKLLKAGIYGFILGLFLSILYYPDVKVINDGNGLITSYPVPLRELIFDILRFSIKTSMTIVFSFWIINFYRNLKKEKFDFKKSVVDFLKVFIIGIIIIPVIFLLIGIIIK